MNARSCFALAALLACLLAAPARTQLLSDGTDPARTAPVPVAPPEIRSDCIVMWFGTNPSGTEVSRLTSLGYAVYWTQALGELTPTFLSQFDFVVMAHVAVGAAAWGQPAIASFVSSGGGLLIHQPNHIGVLDYVPDGFTMNVTDVFWCGLGASSPYIYPTLVDHTHPITAGLTDSDLSGDFDTALSPGPGYTVLARNLECPTSVALAAGTYGAGRVVFETGNLSSGTGPFGTDSYWHNVTSWLCAGAVVPTRTRTWGALKSRYR